MQRTRVKICGITSINDARLAIEAGADALGFVFASESPRYVSAEQAASIVSSLPPFVNAVGLFVSPSVAQVEQCIEQVGIDTLQFHGEEKDDFCKQFKLPFFKALRMHPDIKVDDFISQYPSARAILLDAYQPGKMGGTGKCFDWRRVPKKPTLPVILAGGLSEDNAQDAVKSTGVYALDVSSGVERAPGKKSPEKMQNLMKEVRLADQIINSK